jgi:hypothetical protein
MNTLTPVRSPVSVLKKAVLLAIYRNWEIKTLELPLENVRVIQATERMAANSHPDLYLIREHRSERIVFKIHIYLSNILFSEYNPDNTQWSIFHTFICQEYPIDSKEDQLQIEHLSRLILQFYRDKRTPHDHSYYYDGFSDDEF